jgi:hypothetical protein
LSENFSGVKSGSYVKSFMYAPPHSNPFCNLTSYLEKRVKFNTRLEKKTNCATKVLSLGSNTEGNAAEIAYDVK